jgi:Na+-transporting NADH:ubiquinone oxidoreductase subunit C
VKVNVSHPVYVVVFSAAFAGAFTALVTVLQVSAAGRIHRNEVLRDERALVRVFDLSPSPDSLSADEVSALVRRHVDSRLVVKDGESGRTFLVYRAYEGDNGTSPLKAYAFKISGTGFWAPIEGLLAVNPDRSQSLRAVFTEQKETPGLGGRIQEEAFQRDQFKGLNVTPPPEGKPWVYVASSRPTNTGDPRYGRTVEAITGATQTSRAVGRFVNADLAAFHRAMAAHEKP